MHSGLIFTFNFLFISLLNPTVSYLTEKPSFVKSCQTTDPNFDKCTSESFQQIFDKLRKDGIPEFNLPSVDPLFVDQISLRQQGTNGFNLEVALTNVQIYGLSKIKIQESKISKKDFSRRTKFNIPHLKIDGDYKMKGKILVIALNGHGNCTIELDNLNGMILEKVKLYEKDDLTFINMTNAKIEYKISKLHIRLENLFNGNKELEDSTNQFFNENWQTLNEGLQPLLQDAVSRVILNYFPKMYHNIPAKFFITDIPTSKELYNKQK